MKKIFTCFLLGIAMSVMAQTPEQFSVATTDSVIPYLPLNDNVEAPLYLMRYYERTLANWLLLGGYDVEYDKWSN